MGRYEQHGITINGLHTYNDLGMVAQEIPVIAPPPLKVQTLEIPGADGSIDLTQALAGRELYGRRRGSVRFAAPGVIWTAGSPAPSDYVPFYRSLLRSIHGKLRRCVLDDMPDYYMAGRWTVRSFSAAAEGSEIVLDYDLDPYLYTIPQGNRSWLWTVANTPDPVHYAVYYVNEYRSVSVGNSTGVTLSVSIYGTPGITMTKGGSTYTITASERRFAFDNGNTTVAFQGSGIVYIDFYQGKSIQGGW